MYPKYASPWLVPAFVALCRSSEALEFEDTERLGLRTVVEIARINLADLRFGEFYDVEAADRASVVLIAQSTPSSASTSPITAPSSDVPPPPATSPPLVIDRQHSRLGQLAKGHGLSSSTPLLCNVNNTDCISPRDPDVERCGLASSLTPDVAEKRWMCSGLGCVRGSTKVDGRYFMQLQFE
ncbi:hypothetical protein GGF50DRAFT_128785 [Schizophyllum commune]